MSDEISSPLSIGLGWDFTGNPRVATFFFFGSNILPVLFLVVLNHYNL